MNISKEEARQHYIERIAKAYGHERMKDLLPLQKSKLEASLNRLFEERFENIDDITDAELLGLYEIITEHVMPREFAAIAPLFYGQKDSDTNNSQ